MYPRCASPILRSPRPPCAPAVGRALHAQDLRPPEQRGQRVVDLGPRAASVRISSPCRSRVASSISRSRRVTSLSTRPPPATPRTGRAGRRAARAVRRCRSRARPPHRFRARHRRLRFDLVGRSGRTAAPGQAAGGAVRVPIVAGAPDDEDPASSVARTARRRRPTPARARAARARGSAPRARPRAGATLPRGFRLGLELATPAPRTSPERRSLRSSASERGRPACRACRPPSRSVAARTLRARARAGRPGRRCSRSARGSCREIRHSSARSGRSRRSNVPGSGRIVRSRKRGRSRRQLVVVRLRHGAELEHHESMFRTPSARIRADPSGTAWIDPLATSWAAEVGSCVGSWIESSAVIAHGETALLGSARARARFGPRIRRRSVAVRVRASLADRQVQLARALAQPTRFSTAGRRASPRPADQRRIAADRQPFPSRGSATHDSSGRSAVRARAARSPALAPPRLARVVSPRPPCRWPCCAPRTIRCRSRALRGRGSPPCSNGEKIRSRSVAGGTPDRDRAPRWPARRVAGGVGKIGPRAR